ncbi:MAG TPA: NUDIX hydrolase [Terriglobales bacterium]|nr:NUDIX hydrolase [Terriglobales bacterium]
MPEKPTRSRPVRVLKSTTVFRGPIFYVVSDRVLEPGGVVVRRDIIRHPGSVVIMPVDDTGREPRILLARQYRYAAQARLWELPAGRIDPGEGELAGARRELLEETGYTAAHWQLALRFWVSPGFLDETMAVYMATGLRRGKASPEEDEFISKRFFPLRHAVRLVMAHRIQDAKTIAAVLWLAAKQGKRKK